MEWVQSVVQLAELSWTFLFLARRSSWRIGVRVPSDSQMSLMHGLRGIIESETSRLPFEPFLSHSYDCQACVSLPVNS